MPDYHDTLSTVLAKSTPPETLLSHSAAALAAARKLRQRVGTLRFLAEPLRSRFWDLVEISDAGHDFGKIPVGFQSVLYGRSVAWRHRHEVLSLGWLPTVLSNEHDRDWVAVAIATHHRAITGDDSRGKASLRAMYGDYSIGQFRAEIGPLSREHVQALADWLADQHHAVGRGQVMDVYQDAYDQLDRLIGRWESRRSPEVGLAAVMLQGAVTTADHLSSAHGDLIVSQPLNGAFTVTLQQRMSAQGRKLKPHQEQALAAAGDHVIVRAPTGSGKTIAATLWTGVHVDRIATATGGCPRVFYTLPYLASINAMALTLGNDTDGIGNDTSVGIAHSRSGSYYLHAAADTHDDEQEVPDRREHARQAVARRQATRMFHESIRVTTPYQLLRGALAGPAYSGILLDAANSAFVFDELHAYDPKRLGFILSMMRFLEHIGGNICVLSATMPDVLIDLICETLSGTDMIDGRGHGYPARHHIRTHASHLTDPNTIAAIGDRIDASDAVLVVANNIADAQDLFEALAPIATRHHGGDLDAAVLLHSRYRRVDRDLIEKTIMGRYGTATRSAGGLVVATQCVEVSIDIDMDTLHTSAANLDALMQRFGRVNRTAARAPADVHIHYPHFRTRRGQGEELFADGIYPAAPVEAAWQILSDHDGQNVDEDQVTDWLNAIYSGGFGEEWQAAVRKARDDFTRDLLTFDRPFHDRSALQEQFDKMFDGRDAIMAEDRDAYAEALLNVNGRPTAAGRLLASEFLIPIPFYRRTTWDKELKVHIIDGDYDARLGLSAVAVSPANTTAWYDRGEVF